VKVVAFVPDLMDRSRFPNTADVTFVRSLDDLPAQAGQADLVVVDLNRPGALEAASSMSNERRIGFTNHENVELIESAKAAGIEVMPRSRFFRSISDIVTRADG
jgi:hypothetical protein